MAFKGIKLDPKQKKIVYAVAALVALVIVERLFFSPLRTKLKNLNQQIRLEEAELKTGISMQKRKDVISGEIGRYQSYLEISGSLPEREIVTKFLKEIEKMAGDAHISIISLSPQTQSRDFKDAVEYNADLRAEASPYRIFEFLEKIHASGMLIGLDKLTLAPKDEQASALRLDTTLSIIVPKN
jgi:hypothetical protein